MALPYAQTRYPAALLLLLCSLLFASALSAATGVVEPLSLAAELTVRPGAEPGQATNNAYAHSGEQKRNPFSATTKLMRQTDGPAATSSGPVFEPQGQSGTMPKMRLRGRIQGANGGVVALLEIGGSNVYIVREGDTVGLHEFGLNAVIRIKQISKLDVVIESGSLGQLIIVR